MLCSAIPRNIQIRLSSLSCVLLLTGCGTIDSQKTIDDPLEVNNTNCQALSTLFNESNHNFELIRYRPSYKDKITLWESHYQLIDHSCEIWQWSNRYSYVCSETYPDETTAHEAYERAQNLINQCESSNTAGYWYEKQVLIEGHGEETQYFYKGKLRGSLRKVNTSGLLKNSWSMYFFVDSPPLL